MANKADRVYYENFVAAADYCCKAADFLVESLNAYNPGEIKEVLVKMHDFEHSADKKKHEMSAMLVKAFVTPIDREDMAALSQQIDEVADKIEEVIQRFYVDDVQSASEDCVLFAVKIAGCCCKMKKMLIELENFKKPERLRTYIIEVSDAEEACDKIFLEAMRRTRQQYTDALEVIAWRTIYERMENCADACSHVADLIETIVMKNT